MSKFITENEALAILGCPRAELLEHVRKGYIIRETSLHQARYHKGAIQDIRDKMIADIDRRITRLRK